MLALAGDGIIQKSEQLGIVVELGLVEQLAKLERHLLAQHSRVTLRHTLLHAWPQHRGRDQEQPRKKRNNEPRRIEAVRGGVCE